MKRFQFDSTALRYFLAVVDTGSVNGAAARLNVVSSAVSRQIAGLEQRLHNQLFERHPKGMRVTEVGRILADHARRVEADAARTYAEIDGQNGRYTQTVKIAGAPGFAAYALPRKFAAFQAEHPSIRFSLHILDAGQVSERVRSAQADIGVTYSHSAEKDIAVIYSHPAEIVAVMRPGHPLAACESLHITQLPAYPLALPEGGSTLRQVLDMACSLYNITLSPAFTSNLPDAAYQYVLTGDAVTLCARLTAADQLETGRLICRPINDALLNAGQLQFQTHASRPLSDAAHRFLRFIRSDAPQLF